jgi:uncharacterized membrane protein YeaQ/YmgE (transglycosylase-associated protein family)
MNLDPGGLVAWLVVGLVAGWLAGQFMRGGGYGLIGDIVLGVIGAFAGRTQLVDDRPQHLRKWHYVTAVTYTA